MLYQSLSMSVAVFALVSHALANNPSTSLSNLTVYHLNPASAGALPVNMDTGDARGDLYFYLGEFLLPLECKDASSEGRAHFDCDNPERVDPNLVVTKVEMQIDTTMTSYSLCNLCNGTDPFTHKPCEKGTYVCDCSNREGCDATKIGVESITEQFSPPVVPEKCQDAIKSKCLPFQTDAHKCYECIDLYKEMLNNTCTNERFLYDFCDTTCNSTSPEWGCWAENIPRKTAGFWYSTLAQGQCNETSAPGSCGWKVQTMKTVREQCLKDLLMTRVESYGSSCFQSCGARNVTNPCWIGCFFDTILGKDARHSKTKPLGGMPMSEIEKAWTDAFLPAETGGCAEVFLSEMPQFVV